MSKFYRFLSSPKIRFLDDILIELEKEPVEQNEDYIAPKVCYFDSKPYKIFGSFRLTQHFIPKGKERLYFRIATLYLERENLISIIRVNPYTPTYLINYEGVVLVKSGGLGRKIFLEKLSGILQRLAWTTVFLAFLINTLIQLKLVHPFKASNRETNPSDSTNKRTQDISKPIQKLDTLKSINSQIEKDSSKFLSGHKFH
ncbi:hypothetical protein [Psychroflexus maritimus]|uniref:Uncharacterized protein n=1 Tax=Psychroflexus maritimus TaxID=2714865 RepID=A0A967ADS9_9FLAO|nr:hypothetical protein [Psychroflexus maritimus]NGZ90402.1 hypothetical protein [Psychroflexus maritimus]